MPLLTSFVLYGTVVLTLKLYAQFEVCSFNSAIDIMRTQNSKSRSRDLGHARF